MGSGICTKDLLKVLNCANLESLFVSMMERIYFGVRYDYSNSLPLYGEVSKEWTNIVNFVSDISRILRAFLLKNLIPL